MVRSNRKMYWYRFPGSDLQSIYYIFSLFVVSCLILIHSTQLQIIPKRLLQNIQLQTKHNLSFGYSLYQISQNIRFLLHIRYITDNVDFNSIIRGCKIQIGTLRRSERVSKSLTWLTEGLFLLEWDL